MGEHGKPRLFQPPPGAPLWYYRDVALSVVATIAFVFGLLVAVNRDFGPVFWACICTFGLCTALAGNRATPLASALIFAAIRLAIGFGLSGDLAFLGGAVACALLGLGVFAAFGRSVTK